MNIYSEIYCEVNIYVADRSVWPQDQNFIYQELREDWEHQTFIFSKHELYAALLVLSELITEMLVFYQIISR